MAETRGVFLSYRRTDTQPTAGRLADDLRRAFGEDAVFRDIEDIAPGDNFVATLSAALEGCGVLLAIIGPSWLEQLKRRSERSDGTVDYVRREIECALSLSIAVIPVLVDGAAMPGEQDLPASLQAFARQQFHVQSDRTWRRDTGALLAHLALRLGREACDPFRPAARLSPRLRQLAPALRSTRAKAVAAVTALLVGGAAAVPHLRAQFAPDADVAFVLPPQGQGADANDELVVFEDMRRVLQRALDGSGVEVAPDNIGREDLNRYRLEERDALLAYKSRQGHPRVFIQSKYSLEQPTGRRRVLVTPFPRPTGDRQAWRMVDGWSGRAFDGDQSKRVAIRVGFELIEFLAAKEVLPLQEVNRQQAREVLLGEYRDLLETSLSRCAEETELLAKLHERTASIAGDPTEMRRALDTRCAPQEGGAAPTDRSVQTAVAVYGGALGL